jgi:hypothetical protein
MSSNPIRRGVPDTTSCDKVYQWLILVSTTNKTDRHDITEILLKVALHTLTLFPLSIQTGYQPLHDKIKKKLINGRVWVCVAYKQYSLSK